MSIISVFSWRDAWEDSLLLFDLLNYIVEERWLPALVCCTRIPPLHRSSLRATVHLLVILCLIDASILRWLMADRISLVAPEQPASNLGFVLKVYLRQCTCQVRVLVSSRLNWRVKTLLLNICALVEFRHIPSLPVTIFTTTHCYTVVLQLLFELEVVLCLIHPFCFGHLTLLSQRLELSSLTGQVASILRISMRAWGYLIHLTLAVDRWVGKRYRRL